MKIEVVKHSEAKRGFVLLPRRWVVERDFPWVSRFRRLVKDYERLPATLAGLHFVAFACLFPGVVGLAPSALHRRVRRKLRRSLEPLRQDVVAELVGDPETLIVDSTLLEVLHRRQVKQSAGFDGAAWVRWGSFSVYGVKLPLLCSTNRVPLSYELTAANVAEVKLTEELLEAADLGEDLARRLFGDLACRSEELTDRHLGRFRHCAGDRALPAGWQEAAGGDRAFESQAGLRTW